MRIFVEERDLFLRERIAGAYRCAAWVKGGRGGGRAGHTGSARAEGR